MRHDRFQIILQCLHANNNVGALPRRNPNHDPAIIDILSSEDNHWKYSSGSEVLTGGLTGSLDSSKGSISCGNSNLSAFCTVYRYVGFKS
jgi:hypothetical protein